MTSEWWQFERYSRRGALGRVEAAIDAIGLLALRGPKSVSQQQCNAEQSCMSAANATVRSARGGNARGRLKELLLSSPIRSLPPLFHCQAVASSRSSAASHQRCRRGEADAGVRCKRCCSTRIASAVADEQRRSVVAQPFRPSSRCGPRVADECRRR